jgi:nucleoside-diphosphate-sugar epimerase
MHGPSSGVKRRRQRRTRGIGVDAIRPRPSISGVRLELGRVLSRQTSNTRGGRVHINLFGQQANTLLHDGHAWKDFPRTALSETRRAIHAARKTRASMFVHASFAFVHALERGAELEQPLRSCADAILECEALVFSLPFPACVVRLGYLYGPQSADLLAYRKAFQLGRPYWSGLSAARQYHLHQFDAASALLAVGRAKHAGKLYYATDGHAVSFETFMDAFARRVGRDTPLHLPLVSNLLARVIIRHEHMQQTALGMPPGSPSPRVPGWKPMFRDYRRGLDQVIEAWSKASSR